MDRTVTQIYFIKVVLYVTLIFNINYVNLIFSLEIRNQKYKLSNYIIYLHCMNLKKNFEKNI